MDDTLSSSPGCGGYWSPVRCWPAEKALVACSARSASPAVRSASPGSDPGLAGVYTRGEPQHHVWDVDGKGPRARISRRERAMSGGDARDRRGGQADYDHGMRLAAVQLEARLAEVRANLSACEALAREAAREGAHAIALPELFTTGAAFVPELSGAALAPDGAATAMLMRVARDEGVL